MLNRPGAFLFLFQIVIPKGISEAETRRDPAVYFWQDHKYLGNHFCLLNADVLWVLEYRPRSIPRLNDQEMGASGERQ